MHTLHEIIDVREYITCHVLHCREFETKKDNVETIQDRELKVKRKEKGKRNREREITRRQRI